jgi:hypothetical protein
MIRCCFKYMAIAAMTCLWLAGTAGADTGRGLAGEPLAYDFGCVGVDFDVYHVFHLINHGDETVRVKSVVPSCDCSSVTFVDSVIAPGDTVSFRLRFNTKDYYGQMSRHVAVISDDKRQPELNVYYFSTVGQWLYRVKPDPASLFFLPGQTTKTVSLTNTDVDNLAVREIDLTDDVIVVESVTKAVAKGGTIQLKVTPRKNLVAGTYETNFRVSLDVAGAEQPLLISIPVKIVKY